MGIHQNMSIGTLDLVNDLNILDSCNIEWLYLLMACCSRYGVSRVPKTDASPSKVRNNHIMNECYYILMIIILLTVRELTFL